MASWLPKGGTEHWVATGTDALLVALNACVPKGKVAVSAYTCAKVPAALAAVGFEVVFLDIDPDTGLTPGLALGRFAPGALSAVIASHMFGVPCDLDEYRRQADRLGAILIEDCAASFGSAFEGAPVGSFGHLSVYSFGRGKTVNLGGGGLLAIREAEAAAQVEHFCREAIQHGTALRRGPKALARALLLSTTVWGPLFKAALVAKRLAKGTWFWERDSGFAGGPITNGPFLATGPSYARLAGVLDLRALLDHKVRVAEVYQAEIHSAEHIAHLRVPAGVTRVVRPSYPLRVENRDKLFLQLRAEGIDCGLSFSYSAGALLGAVTPGATALANALLTLPVHGGVSLDQASRIARLVNELK